MRRAVAGAGCSAGQGNQGMSAFSKLRRMCEDCPRGKLRRLWVWSLAIMAEYGA